MPNYAIKRAALVVGAKIVSTAQPGLGKVLELTKIHPTGYDRASGANRSFIEYDFREVESGAERRSFTLNYINRYFALQL